MFTPTFRSRCACADISAGCARVQAEPRDCAAQPAALLPLGCWRWWNWATGRERDYAPWSSRTSRDRVHKDRCAGLHDDEELALVLIDIVDRADMGMVQGRCSTGFPSKTIDSLVVPGKLFREEFQRHRATQPGVLGLIDDTHSSATQLLKDSKVQNGLSDHNRRRSLLLAGHVRPRLLASQPKLTPCPWILWAYTQEECPRNFIPERPVLQLRVSGQTDDVG